MPLKSIFRPFVLISGVLCTLLFVSPVFAQQVSPHESQNQLLLQYDDDSLGYVFLGRTNPSDSSQGIKWIPAVSHYVCQIDMIVAKDGSPTDGLNLKIYQNGTNLTNGDLLWTSYNTVSASDINTAPQETISFWFGSINPPGVCFAVVGGETYFIELNRTGSDNDTNKYKIYYADDFIPDGDTVAGYGDRNGAWTPPFFPAITIYGIYDGSAISSGTDVSDFCASAGILAGTCNLFAGLFIPDFDSPAIQSKIDSLNTTLEDKAPFAYFNALNSIDSSPPSTTSAIGLYLPVHIGTGSGAINMDIPFVTTGTEIANFISGFKLTTTFMCWLGFLAYLFFLQRRVFPQ